MRASIALSALLVVFCSFSTIEETISTTSSTTATYPTVFVIGQNADMFETLNDEYSTLLLTVCNDDMKKAFRQWKHTLSQIEQYAHLNGMNLNGVKMWIKVFWSPSGHIEHIAFDLKPQSAKINKKKLAKLLEDFVQEYSTDEPSISAETKFSHYGSVGYPVYPATFAD